MGEKRSDKFRLEFDFRKSATWDRRLYFPSEGRRAEDFFTLKNPTASARFEPANLGTEGQHATSRPPKTILSYKQVKLNLYYNLAFGVPRGNTLLLKLIKLIQR